MRRRNEKGIKIIVISVIVVIILGVFVVKKLTKVDAIELGHIGISQSYNNKILRSEDELNKFMSEYSIPRSFKTNFSKYNYIVVKVEKHSICDADVRLKDINYSSGTIIINTEYYNVNETTNCKESTDRILLVPIKKSVKDNPQIIVNALK